MHDVSIWFKIQCFPTSLTSDLSGISNTGFMKKDFRSLSVVLNLRLCNDFELLQGCQDIVHWPSKRCRLSQP